MPASAPIPLPPDRGHIATERRAAASRPLDALTTRAALARMADDHRTVAAAVERAGDVLAAFIDDLAPRLGAGGRLVYVGAGTSGRLGVLDAAECPPTFHVEPAQVIGLIAGGDAALRRSSEGLEDDPGGAAADLEALDLTRRDTVVGIAAGGTTPYVRGAVMIAQRRGALTALLTCAGASTPPLPCDHLIALDTGPELLAGSTRLKAGSATKLALNVITTLAFTQLGKVYDELMVDLRATNEKLRDRALRILVTLCPPLARPEAAEVLRRADGSLKLAIAMQRLGVDRAEAARRLERTGGRLRPVLDPAVRAVGT